jgi:O-antigen ligase
MQLGAVAAILAVSTHKTFELDRFLISKELALHATTLVAGLFAIGAVRRLRFTRVDVLLTLYVVLSLVAAVVATNVWLGFRAFAVSTSAVAVFWIARGLRESGLARPLLAGLALAVVVAAVTSLLQAYGVRTELFSINRSPGGTLGNRNSVAHVAAFGLPVLMLVALHARRTTSYLAAAIGIALVTGTLVLTRSRAAWLATAVMLVVFIVTIFASRTLRRDGRTWRRLGGIGLLAAAGVAAALLVPNTLRWRSDNPYLESIQDVAAYDEGSGRGRLVQYERSLIMAARHPLFGVGPGNWPVEYPDHAARNDPSLDGAEPGTTYNPWPSSDWIAFVSERGFAAAIVLALVFLLMATAGFRRGLEADDPEEALAAAALLATTIAAGVTGLFDAVLLLGAPTLIVWAVLGASWTPPAETAREMPAVAFVALLVFAGAGLFRNVTQLVAMEMYSSGLSLSQAAAIDPGNYRIRLRLAQRGGRGQRCRHAKAAHNLFPHAEAARSLSRGCPE